ncbi:hypothetical protein BJ322DRAFT_1020693 [Thelephora terrestris]|uniref:Uncharacterized protein n=1 Tax=Thelephora terrestris TaxID=56493 RepID=A0A9P6HFW3_9AGAM|nr:hypothetical protein BJ322DRAFT_1020693 [Thelephora terrestris]
MSICGNSKRNTEELIGSRVSESPEAVPKKKGGNPPQEESGCSCDVGDNTCESLLFCDEDEFERANAHIEQAKSHTVDHTHDLGLAMYAQAWIWYRQGRLPDAKSETLRALGIFEKLGLVQDEGKCREILQEIEQAMESQPTSDTGGSPLPPVTFLPLFHRTTMDTDRHSLP